MPRTKFIDEEDMRYFKTDLFSLVNIYKFHALHFITQQAIKVNEMLRSKKQKLQEDETDYSDTEFTDLMD